MPQEDHAFYDAFLTTYNVTELVRGPVHADTRAWARTAMGKEVSQAILDPRMKSATPPIPKRTEGGKPESLSKSASMKKQG